MKNFFSLSAITLMVIVSCAKQQEVKSPIEGVWQMTEYSVDSSETKWTTKSPQPSLFIFAKDYYSIIYVSTKDARPLMPEGMGRSAINDELFREIFSGIIANSGKYELNGTKLTTHSIVALEPNVMDGAFYIDYEYKLMVDTMWLTRSVISSYRYFKLLRLE